MRCIILIALLCAQPLIAAAFTTVVIDAGHGGADPGTAWYGYREKNLCLDIALRLEAALRERGLRTVMTRRTDKTLSLSSRAAIANRYSSAVFVSLHFNASRDRSANGFQACYLSPRGKTLGQRICSVLDRTVPGRNRGAQHQNLKVLRDTRCPAVLIECGFLSNYSDSRNCASSAHRQKIAVGIASALAALR